MMEIRFDKTKDEVALLIWFLVDHSVCFHLLCDKIAVLFWKRSPQLSQTYRVISSLQVAKSETWGLLLMQNFLH
jgi:hypothetical protein